MRISITVVFVQDGKGLYVQPGVKNGHKVIYVTIDGMPLKKGVSDLNPI